MSESLQQRSIDLPEGVEVQADSGTVKVTGPKGSLSEDLSHLPVDIEVVKKRVLVTPRQSTKRCIAKAGTAAAHVKNMIRGVTKGFTYKLKTVYAHFPVTVKVNEKEKKVMIENFTGEKTARVTKIIGDTKVKVSGEEILVQGTKLEDVSQTASNIEIGTKIKDKDQRVFLDGIYIYEKAEGM
jgi:large subunit ribosomal protein L6